MPALQVRDFPSDLYEELKLSAEQDHRSIAQQTIALINDSLRNARAQSTTPAISTHRMPPWIPQSESPTQQKERLNRREALLSHLLSDPVIPSKKSPNPVSIVQESRDERNRELSANLPMLG